MIRMRLRSVRGLLKFVALAVVGCSGSLSSSFAASNVLTEVDSGKSLHLAVGARFTVQLRSNSGTGYRWDVTPVNEDVVTQEGLPDSQPTSPARPGSQAITTLSFLARAPGTARIEIVYHRPWEHGVPPAKTFVVELTVR
jgi:inhibitor of cysteine peptidase